MAPPARHPSPQAQLLVLAADARRRGLSFDEFWAEARRPGKRPVTWTTPSRPPGAIIWPSDSALAREALHVTDDVRDGWRRAYEGEPQQRAEAALTRLFSDVSDIGLLEAVA